MNFNIGETLEIKGIKFFILDLIDDNPFIIALDTGINSIFSNHCNDYCGSTLQDTADKWFKEINLPAIPRTLDLTTMDGGESHGTITTKAAPLTFNEWRKYAKIIIPYIKESFWLATGWSDPIYGNWGTNTACAIYGDGVPSSGTYNASLGFAPALILDKKFFEDISPLPDKSSTNMLVNFTMEELFAEISRRIKKS